MKKIFLFTVFGLLVHFTYAQTFVSTDPANRNVILEEFTGINCQYCPDGHHIANQIAAANPGRFWAINIHAGGFAPTSNPNYHSQDGDVIHNNYLSSISGYPCGMINRNGILNRGVWASNTNSYLKQASYVNVAAQGNIDFTERKLSITVEAYYTGSGVTSENFLTLAMMQNNILGPQSGGSTNPDQYLGGSSSTSYRHMHVLRDIISPTWGEPITETTVGSFFTKTYTYDIPEAINNIPVIIQDLEFLVWISEQEKNNIITGNIAKVTYNNLPFIAPTIYRAMDRLITTCEEESSIALHIRSGSEPVKSMEVKYSIADGNPYFFTWTSDREIPELEFDTINLPVFGIATNANQKITAELTKVNDTEITGTPSSVTIKKNIANAEGEFWLVFELKTDRYAGETTWKFFDEEGNVLEEDGPYSNLPSNGTTTHTYNIDVSDYGCYRLEVYDSYGDGINSGSGAGGFKVYKDFDGKVILTDNGKFGSQATYMIIIDEYTGIEGVDTDEALSIYPNPVSDQLHIRGADPVQHVAIFDMLGRLIMTKQGNVQELSTSELPTGMYMIRITTNNSVLVKKFTKQ